MPPHAGHEYLFAAAQRQVDELHVVLFSKAHEPIPGDVRLGWLRELLPQAAVYLIDREHPVDFADRAAWEFWVSAIRAVLPRPPTVVFSSETYGDELARRLGARHVPVDPDRRQVPISATQIRASPLEYWDYLPPPVRPYYVRRVAILGAESTGKTTRARALADRFQTEWVPEYAREYLLASGRPCTPDDLRIIARQQATSEDGLARQARRLLICDTNVLTTQIWHEHYFGSCPPEIRQTASDRAADLYLLCSPDVPWVADGLRDSVSHRQWFHQRYQSELDARALPYVVLAGPFDQRLADAVAAVERLLAGHEWPAPAQS